MLDAESASFQEPKSALNVKTGLGLPSFPQARSKNPVTLAYLIDIRPHVDISLPTPGRNRLAAVQQVQ